MFSQGRQTKRRASLDISPLLDIAFQLIIFFAVSTTFLEQSGMQLELPESTTAAPEATAPTIVSIGSDGTIRFQGETLTPEALEAAIAALPEEKRVKVTVRADRSVEYGLVVRVIDALRNAGAEGLSLPMEAVDREPEGQGRGPSGGPPGGGH